MLRGVIYARYSCDKQTDNSIRGQVRECTLFAERNDIRIINTYADEAISGRTDKRPAFLKMIRDANQHMFDVIVVWKGDRFSRNRADAAKYKNELKKLGIKLLSATEANLTGAEAVLMDGVNEAFAEFYSVELAEKVNRGMKQNLLDGKHIGGSLILGYKVEDHKVVVDEEKAKIVKDAFNYYAYSDISIRELSKKLNSLGYKISGKNFTPDSCYRTLSNRKYIGEFKYKGEVYLNCYPVIIEKDLFDKVQTKLNSNKRIGGHYRTPEKYILSGKLFCGECGSPMKAYAGISGGAKKGLYRYYRCGGTDKVGCQRIKYNKGPLEKAVIDLLTKYITQDMDIELITKKVMDSFSNVNPEIARLETALADVEVAIKNYKYALEKGLDLDDTIERLKELSLSKKAYQTEIDKRKKQEDYINPDTIRAYLKQIASRDYSLNENRVYLINTLVYKIIVYKDDRIRIILNVGGDDDPTILDSSVQVLMDSDHQILRIINILNRDGEFTCHWMTIPMSEYHKAKKKD